MADESHIIMDLHDCASMCDVCDETKYIPKYRIEYTWSLIHFFGKAKRLPDAVSILLMVVGTVISPFTHIVSLLGVLDLGINLKRMIKK